MEGVCDTQLRGAQKRDFKNLTLIQMDLIVRDERAPTGWIFGNYQYNGKMGNTNRWKNLVPIDSSGAMIRS